VLLFPMIAASLVLWTGANAAPVLGFAAALAASSDEIEEDTLPVASRGAKRPSSKSRIHPKRKKRATAFGVAAQQAMADEMPHLPSGRRFGEPVAPFVRLQRTSSGCPREMAAIDGAYCIDLYEASLVEHAADGEEREWPYYDVVPGDVAVRAVSLPGVYPQGYISGVQAREACERSGKRLCKPDEWRNACRGPNRTIFPYGNERQVGRCNDNGRSSMRFFNPQLDSNPEHRWMWGKDGNMADPRLNQLEGTLTRTGERTGCTNEYGVFDMVGNLHEWVDDPDGTFQGGYYLDTHLNGDGCNYRTTAHPVWHLDYSTGFRCCVDAAQ
jgi:sulfatase modifying factor 1